MARTTAPAVRAVLGQDYDQVKAPSLTPYIDIASAVVSRTASAAAARGIVLSTTELEIIERWLGAHYYTKMDPTYSSKSTEGASGSLIRGKENPEPYKDAAINADYSGCLSAILKRQFAQAVWLGKPPSQQIPVDQRD